MTKQEIRHRVNYDCREYVSEPIEDLTVDFMDIDIDEAIQRLQDIKLKRQEIYEVMDFRYYLEWFEDASYENVNIFGIRKRTEEELKIYDEEKKNHQKELNEIEYKMWQTLRSKYGE